MSAVPHGQHRLQVVPCIGAREEQAHRIAAEVRDRLRIVACRALKAFSPHTRQEFARRLDNEPGHRFNLEDLTYAIAALSVDDRTWLLEPLLRAEEPKMQPVMIELAEATAATGSALSEVQRLLAYGPCTPLELQEINVRFHAAVRELGDVPRAFAVAR